MSHVAVILFAAIAAASFTEFVSGALRSRFLLNRWAMRRWLLSGLRSWPAPVGRVRGTFRTTSSLQLASWQVIRGIESLIEEPVDWEEARLKHDARQLDRQVVALATGDDRGAFYRLEADQLAAQVSAAAEAVLTNPKRHLTLLVALARLQKRELEAPVKKTGGMSISEYCRLENVELTRETPQGVVAARRHLIARIQRRIDELQIKTRGLQEISDYLVALLFASVAAWVLLWAYEPFPLAPERWWAFMVPGVIAGLSAPVLRRLLSALNRR